MTGTLTVLTPAQLVLARAMPENGGSNSLDWALRQKLESRPLAGRLKYQHNSDSRKAHRDWPDWVIGGPGGVIVRELKREGKHPTPGQQEWLDLLAAAGTDAGVWTPADLLSGRIDDELMLIAGLTVTR